MGFHYTGFIGFKRPMGSTGFTPFNKNPKPETRNPINPVYTEPYEPEKPSFLNAKAL